MTASDTPADYELIDKYWMIHSRYFMFLRRR